MRAADVPHALQCKKDLGKGEGHERQRDRIQSLCVHVRRTHHGCPFSWGMDNHVLPFDFPYPLHIPYDLCTLTKYYE